MPTLATLLLTMLLAGPIQATKAQPPKIQPPKAASDRCATKPDKADGTKVATIGTLRAEPPAAQVATVYRRDAHGCPQPVVLRDKIGANPDKALPIAGEGKLHKAR